MTDMSSLMMFINNSHIHNAVLNVHNTLQHFFYGGLSSSTTLNLYVLLIFTGVSAVTYEPKV